MEEIAKRDHRRERHRAFMRVVRRLGTTFGNLDAPRDEVTIEWYRLFGDAPVEVLDEAATRAIARHEGSRLQPAHFRAFVDEATRDHRAELVRDTATSGELCRDPACPNCGGEGTFRAEIQLGKQRHEFTVVCDGDDHGGDHVRRTGETTTG